jgi:hypothetical protein
MDAMTRAYLECALWSSTGDDDEPLDKDYAIEDLAPEAIAKAAEDCAKFAAMAAHHIEASGLTPESVGHDFWLTRCGHGVGFWDRDLGTVGEHLTVIAHSFGEASPYVGDDKRLYIYTG